MPFACPHILFTELPGIPFVLGGDRVGYLSAFVHLIRELRFCESGQEIRQVGETTSGMLWALRLRGLGRLDDMAGVVEFCSSRSSNNLV